ncbi:MAG: hypothetical protein GQ475_02585 [Methylococcaceae bacterium]|nr:hypothetical protein [Methylococcaceae bacterium]
MEITHNPVQTITLEGVTPTKVPVVKAEGNDENIQFNTNVSQKEVEKKDKSSEQAENLQVAVSQINDYVQNLQRNLQFTVDEESGKDVVTVIDSQSEEVIRQIPSEEALELARRLAANKEDGVQLISTQV